MRFYLGTHMEAWLGQLGVPLFVSHRRLRKRKRMPVARTTWALDSGAFTELDTHGRWTFGVDEYIEYVHRYEEEVGKLAWAAPMDWMCEPWIIKKTGKSVAEHQELTIENYLEIRGRGPFIPVLQGWAIEDYWRHVELYYSAGVDLTKEKIVGVGSVCRRQHTDEIGDVFKVLSQAGISCHGFGVKTIGLKKYGEHLSSSDSMSWSYTARREGPLPGCTHLNCANCHRYALIWRANLLSELERLRLLPEMGEEWTIEDRFRVLIGGA